MVRKSERDNVRIEEQQWKWARFSLRVVAVGSGAVLSCTPEPGLGSAVSGSVTSLWPLGVLEQQEQHCYGQELHLEVGYLMYCLQCLHKVLLNREIGKGCCGVGRGNWFGGLTPCLQQGQGSSLLC